MNNYGPRFSSFCCFDLETGSKIIGFYGFMKGSLLMAPLVISFQYLIHSDGVDIPELLAYMFLLATGFVLFLVFASVSGVICKDNDEDPKFNVKLWLYVAPFFYLGSCILQYNVFTFFWDFGIITIVVQIIQIVFDIYSLFIMLSVLDYYQRRHLVPSEVP